MRIELTNILGEEKKSFIFPDNKFTLLQGDNGTGKTSLLEALAWALHGKARTDLCQPGSLVRVELPLHTVAGENASPLLVVKRWSHPQRLRVTLGTAMFEGDAAQAEIDRIFEPRKVWESASYLRQLERNRLIDGKNAHRMDILTNMTFADEGAAGGPEYVLDALQKELSYLREEMRHAERRLRDAEDELATASSENSHILPLSSFEQPLNEVYSLLRHTPTTDFSAATLQPLLDETMKQQAVARHLTEEWERAHAKKTQLETQLRALGKAANRSLIESNLSSVRTQRDEAQARLHEVQEDMSRLANAVALHKETINRLEHLRADRESFARSIEVVTQNVDAAHLPRFTRENVWAVASAAARRVEMQQRAASLGLEYTSAALTAETARIANELVAAQKISQWLEVSQQLATTKTKRDTEARLLVAAAGPLTTGVSTASPTGAAVSSTGTAAPSTPPATTVAVSPTSTPGTAATTQQQQMVTLNEAKEQLRKAEESRTVRTCPSCSSPLRIVQGELQLSKVKPTTLAEIKRLQMQVKATEQYADKVRAIAALDTRIAQMEELLRGKELRPIDTVPLLSRQKALSAIEFIATPEYDPVLMESSLRLREAQATIAELLKRNNLPPDTPYNAALATILLFISDIEKRSFNAPEEDYAAKHKESDLLLTAIRRTNSELSQLTEEAKRSERYDNLSNEISRLRLDDPRAHLAQLDSAVRILRSAAASATTAEKIARLVSQRDERKEEVVTASARVVNHERLKKCAEDTQNASLQLRIDTINKKLETIGPEVLNEMYSLSLSLFRELKGADGLVRNDVDVRVSVNGSAPRSSKKMSPGESARISLALTTALGVLSSSPLLLLDEPFSGVSVSNTVRAVNALRSLFSDGTGLRKTIILVSHAETDGLFDNIVRIGGN